MILTILLSKLSTTSNLIPGLIEELDIYQIEYSPFFDTSLAMNISGLAHSIEQKGLLHPIMVRFKEHKYEIVAGNRRYLACKNLGRRKIMCHIVELDDKEAFEVSLIENIQRKALTPIEEARAFKVYVSELGWGGITDLASKIGKSVTYIDRRLGLLDLPSDVIDKLSNSLLTTTLAEELIPLHNPKKQSKLAELIVKNHLSCKEARSLKVSKSENNDLGYFVQESAKDLDSAALKAFDKSIIALRITINKLADIIKSVEDNWIIYETLMQHRNLLHQQIDLLIKQKRKI